MRGFGSCYQRGKVWWIQFWHGGARKRESTGSEKLKAAQDLLKRRLAEEESLLPRSAVVVTVRHLYGALELDYVINKRKSLRNVRQVWETHLKKAFGEAPAHLVTPEEITVYIAARQKAGAKNATINRELAALKRMYTLAIRTRRLATKPYIPQLEERNVRKGFVKDAQYAALALATGRTGLWLRTMFEVAYTYGWRKSELLQMRVRQVDLIERTIELDPGETKNDEARKVEMTDAIYELVRQCVSGKSQDDHVFTRDRESNGRKTKTQGGRITDFRVAWEKACTEAGCQGLLFHDLRRSGVRNMRRSGIGEKVAMVISGHKTRSVFERYNIVDRDDVRAAVKKLDHAAQGRRQRELFEQGEIFRQDQVERKPPAGITDAETERRKLQ